MATINQARIWLTGIKGKLERPSAFYREHYLLWRDLARRVAATALERLKPANVGVQQWNAAVAVSLDTVSSALVEGADFTGAAIWMLRHIEPSKPGLEPYPSMIPFETIVEWVRAGREGEAGGKRLRLGGGEIDEGKTDRQIAWRVFHAIRLRKNPRLYEAVMAWASEAGTPQVLQAVDAVQVAWEAFFTVQCAEDWTRYVAAAIREP